MLEVNPKNEELSLGWVHTIESVRQSLVNTGGEYAAKVLERELRWMDRHPKVRPNREQVKLMELVLKHGIGLQVDVKVTADAYAVLALAVAAQVYGSSKLSEFRDALKLSLSRLEATPSLPVPEGVEPYHVPPGQVAEELRGVSLEETVSRLKQE